MLKNALFISMLLLFLLSCRFGENQSPLLPEEPLQTNSRAAILNGIIVHESGGLVIRRAFLSDESGRLIPPKNTVPNETTTSLNLLVQKGWQATNDSVRLGATQTITTGSGKTVLASPDLFAGLPPFPRHRANNLQLKATLRNIRRDTQVYVIRYHIWDKGGKGEVRGQYRLQVTSPAKK